jgi:hypothetical protein
MKNIKLIITAFILLIITGCNKESYIESVGKVIVDGGDDTKVGHYIFTALSSGIKCGNIDVYMDDVLIGNITQVNTANITCKTAPVHEVILRAVVATGTHKIIVKFKDECKKDITMTHSIEQGKCQWYYIQ